MKDRVLFWFGADFTQFCMSYYFQKKYDCDMYSIVDITNNPKHFFKNQTLVNFEKTWYLHDQYESSNKKPNLDYLKKFEKKYNINLWQLAINERIFYGFFNFHHFNGDEILSILEQICRFYENIFSEIKPDFFITKLTAFHHLELFRRMCKYHGTKVLMLSNPKIPTNTIISEDDTKIDYVESIENIECTDKSFEDLRNLLHSLSKGTEAKNIVSDFWNKHGSNSIKKRLISLIQFIFSPNTNIKTHYNYYGRTKFRVIKNSIDLLLKRKYRESFIDKHLEKIPFLDSPFIYFPLAVVLERHVLIGAPYYTNQVELIRHIVKSLPTGYQLLVKEHPAQKSREWRPVSVYQEIMDIPNVILIHPSFDDELLVKKSSLVFSTAGSTAFQAAFFEKPSLVFGDVIYSYLPFVTKVDVIEKLPEMIKKSLNMKVYSKDLSKYMELISKNLFNFNFLEFFNDFNQRFTYGGGYVDTQINEDEMKNFLKEKSDSLNYLSICHIEKIQQHKKMML